MRMTAFCPSCDQQKASAARNQDGLCDECNGGVYQRTKKPANKASQAQAVGINSLPTKREWNPAEGENMPATATTKNYYGELVGKTILAIHFEDDDLGGRDPFPIITFTDGTTAAVQCDPEGNGAGFLCIEQPVKCDQCSKWIAKGEDYYNVKQVCGTETRTVTRCTACVEKKKVGGA